MPAPMPAIFFGHGNPMNAIQQNAYTRAWTAIGRALPRPRAIVCISAHWYGEGTQVTAMDAPRTIHDFGGFPRELFAVEYAAPGDPLLAERIQSLLSPVRVTLDQRWGLDHGTWSVLYHVFPQADIPVVQLSIDESRGPAFHFELGARLSALRDDNILVMGSGNMVHNLHAYAWGKHPVEPLDWAVRFEKMARECMQSADVSPLVEYQNLGRDAMLSAPTPDHYLPLLYVLGLRRPSDPLRFPVEGFDGGSISMLTVQVG